MIKVKDVQKESMFLEMIYEKNQIILNLNEQVVQLHEDKKQLQEKIDKLESSNKE